MADFVLIFFTLNEIALFLKCLCDKVACLFCRKTAELLGTDIVQRSIRIEDVDRLEIVSLSTLPVVRVMSRSDLNHTGSELDSYEAVGNDRNLAVCKRELEHLAHKALVTLVIRVDCNSLVSEHGLRSCRCHCDVAASVCERISDIKQMSCILLMLDLVICQSCSAVRAVVHEVKALVDQATLIKRDECLPYGLRESLIHGEALTGPVT